MRVLIIDEQMHASALAGELRSAGHFIVGTVGTSRDAVQLANANQIDVALIDIDLEHDGVDAELAVEFVADKNVDVVLCTARSELARRCQSGAVGLLSKPFLARDAVDGLTALSAMKSGSSCGSSFPSSFELLISPQ